MKKDTEASAAGKTRTTAPHSRSLLKLGPGLITGAADDDPAGIGTYSVAGAQFGFQLLWLIWLCVPLMIAVQEMCGRVAIATNHGLSAVLRDHYPRWLLYSVVTVLIAANTVNVYADINIMAASLRMLFGLPFALWATLLTAGMVAAQIAIPYKVYVKFLKYLCLALLSYMVIAFLPQVHVKWPLALHQMLIPHFSTDTAYVLTVVAFLGTTISPYLFFWQAGEQIEDEIQHRHIGENRLHRRRSKGSEIRASRADTAEGMIYSQIITAFIIVATAATLHASGITDINTAQDAARALLPLGSAAYWLFTLGILGVGLLAVPTLAGSAAYAVAEAAGWRFGLYRKFSGAKGFYLVIALVIVIGYLLNFVATLSPVKALLYSAVLNGLIAPPLIVVLLLICNNRKIVHKYTNGRWSNVFGVLAAVFMAAAGGIFIWTVLKGKA